MTAGLDDETLREIVWESLSILERCQVIDEELPDSSIVTSPVDNRVVQEWAEEWHDTTPEKIIEYTTQRGYSERTVTALGDTPRINQTEWFPPWGHEIDSLVEFFGENNGHEITACVDNRDETPFEPFVSTVVQYATEKLNTGEIAYLSDAAVTSLSNWLVDDVVDLVEEALYEEFDTQWREPVPAYHEQSDGESVDSSTNEPRCAVPCESYDAFIASIHSTRGITDLFAEYPVLARWLVVLVEQWVDTISQLDSRLQTDWSALKHAFCVPESVSEVQGATVVEADRHEDGRRVAVLDVTETTQIVYKPTTVEPEKVFESFLRDVNAETPLSIRTKTVISCEEYGWTEYIEHTPCTSESGVETYYRNAGGLLAAAYLLYLNDAHYENVIATHQSPVLVDSETVFGPVYRPNFRSTETVSQDDIRNNELLGSVCWTGFLKQAHHEQQHELQHNDVACVNGFIQPNPPKHSALEPLDWKHINTDLMQGMKPDSEIAPITNPVNIPRLDDELQLIHEFTSDVVDGFETVCEAVLGNELEPPEVASSIQTRLLFRASSMYNNVISTLQTPSVLRDGKHITYCYSKLISPDIIETQSADEWVLFHNERTALKRLDIPQFSVDSHTGEIYFDGDTILQGVVDTPGYQRVLNRFDSLSTDDVRTQADYIKLTCSPSPNLDTHGSNSREQLPREIKPDVVLDVVAEIWEMIIDDSESLDDGSPTWLHRTVVGGDVLMVQEMGDGLYNGRIGIAVFAAVVAKYTDIETAEQTAVSIAASILNQVAENPETVLHSGVGLRDGAAGYVYGLSVIARVLDDSFLLDEAATIADDLLIDADLPRKDTSVATGVPGVILTLLVIHRETSTDVMLEEAIRLGELLIESVETTRESKTCDPGVHYTLYQLSQVTGNDKFDLWNDSYCSRSHSTGQGVGDGMVSTSLYTVAINSITHQHGDEMHVIPENPLLSQEMNCGEDSLTTGTAGWITALAGMRDLQGKTENTVTMEQMIQSILQNHSDTGEFTLPIHTPYLQNNTLSNGITGIGYALLYSEHPDTIPNVLLVE